MRVFLDTNVLVSALATRGLCADLYERLITEHETVIGEPVILEVLDILQRKFKATPTLLVNIEAELRLLEVIPAQETAPNLPIKDKEDPWIIAWALQADVEFFVTGDAELLDLGKADKLPIISPRECWQKLS